MGITKRDFSPSPVAAQAYQAVTASSAMEVRRNAARKTIAVGATTSIAAKTTNARSTAKPLCRMLTITCCSIPSRNTE